MKYKLILSFFLITTLWWTSCGDSSPAANNTEENSAQKVEEKNNPPQVDRKAFKLRDGVYIERPSPEAMQVENPYNEDNRILLPNRSFIYSYVHYRPNGQKMYCLPVDGSAQRVPLDKSWIYHPVEEANDETITKIKMEVVDGYGRMGRFLTQKDMTFIAYTHLTQGGQEIHASQVGAIENSQNLFINPVRTQLFNLMQSCPFPYIKAPYELGNKWEWKSKVPGRFSDPRWGDWQGEEQMTYQYEVKAKKQIDSKFGMIECLEIMASGGGLIGKSSLVALFHPDYGFMRLSYKHIDGSATVFELEEIIDKQPDGEQAPAAQ